MYKALKEEISHWLFLESWDDPLHWRDDRHISIRVASDASNSGSGGSLPGEKIVNVSDYWSPEELLLDITTREALALQKVLLSFPCSFLLETRPILRRSFLVVIAQGTWAKLKSQRF
jgi:hypothetical protein